MSTRWTVFAALAAGAVLIGSLAFLFAWPTDRATVPPSGSSQVLRSGSPASLPSGGSAGYDHNRPVHLQSSARDIYLRTADKAKVFAELEARSEPEAKYYAYRAVADCELVLGSSPDWHSIEYEARALIATNAHDIHIQKEQLAALELWKTACSGFTRPNALPTARMASLLKEAASQGFTSAQLAQQWKDLNRVGVSFDLDVRRAAVERAWKSDDPTAPMEAEWALYAVRHDTPILGLGTADAETLTVALILLKCDLEPNCGNFGLIAAGRCIALAICVLPYREAALAMLPEQERRRAEVVARKLVEAFREKNPAQLHSKPPNG